MSDSKVELKRFTSDSSGTSGLNNSSSTWQAPSSVGDMNPTYHGINGDSGTGGDRVYDSVPGQDMKSEEPEKKPAPPTGRRTTTNTVYESATSTLHPQTLPGRAGYTNGNVAELDEYSDEPSSSCVRSAFMFVLTLLVIVSLFLAIVAVVLVLLLWFNVISSTQECSVSQPTPSPSSPVTAGVTGGCSCEELDIQPIIDQISQKAANLTAEIEKLSTQVDQYAEQNSNLNDITSSLNVAVNDVNSSCLSSLSSVTAQLGSIEGLNFEAQLLNVGVFNSCIYEYVDECQMDQNEFDCQTDYVPPLVPGYSNIDLACHIGVSESSLAITYAPITNLRFNTTDSNNPPLEMLANSTVRCECSLVAILENPSRGEIFHCKLYRSRCPTSETYSTTIVT